MHAAFKKMTLFQRWSQNAFPISPPCLPPVYRVNQDDLTGCDGLAYQLPNHKAFARGFVLGPCSRDCFAKGAKQSRKPWLRAAHFFAKIASFEERAKI
ncbi:MAG: hypothetical protein H7834_09310 [Magnetococcus sp. YQC-9]